MRGWRCPTSKQAREEEEEGEEGQVVVSDL